MPKRSAFGSIAEIDKGKRYVVRWVQNTPEGRKRKSHTVRGTRREAQRYLAEMQLAHGDERPCPTIGQAYETWYLPWMERQVDDGRTSPRTMECYTRCWDVEACKRWSRVALDQVRPLDVQKWLLTLSAGTAKYALIVLRKIGDFAVQYEVAESNKFRIPYEMPRATDRKKRPGVYSLAEADAMLAKLHGSTAEPCYILSAFGSCRVGESCAVRLDDVTDEDGWAVVRIDKQMPPGSADKPVMRTKNPQSVRDVIVPPPYSTRLFEIAEERRAFGTEWLCDRGDGLPLSQNRLVYEWERMGGDVPFSNLRNSWRTFAQFEWGVDYDTCEVLMGHALEGVTGKHYLRPTTDQLIQKMAEALAGSGHNG